MERVSKQHQISLSTHLKDPASCISHMIGAIMALIATYPLVTKAYHLNSFIASLSMIIFCTTLILLYSSSALYHGVIATKRVERRLKKLDHMMIYALIAGTYTPICLLVLPRHSGLSMLIIVWSIAFVGMTINMIWIYCPKWINSIVYIAMGWVVSFAMKAVILGLGATGFAWLLAGGIIYTIGGIIYALKLPIFNKRHKNFGTHDIFHIFCIAGSMCHYILMYYYVIK